MRGLQVGAAAASISLFLSAAAQAQLPPPAELLPAGFQVVEETNMGAAMSMIKGAKPADKPAGGANEEITIEIGWQQNPFADRIIEMIAGQPEEPGEDIPGLLGREEPCGKQRYRGGVFTCREQTIQAVGSDEPPRVTLHLSWQGKSADGLVSIGIGNPGSREAAMGWLDTVISRLVK